MKLYDYMVIEEDNFFGENPDPRREKLERALAERAYWEQRSSEKRIFPKEDSFLAKEYYNFYENGFNLSLNTRKYIGNKRKLLERCFPSRFGKNGDQPIENKSDSQVGILFIEEMRIAGGYGFK